MKTTVNINPRMITWAIARAGRNLEEFTKPFPKIHEWLDGSISPTIKQLEAFSKKVHLPFGYLLLQEPPKEELPIPFFRTNGTKTNQVSINVYDTILLLQQRQDWLREYLIDSEHKECSFVGKFRNNSDYLKIAANIRDTLGLPHNWASNFNTWEDARKHLIEKIEEIGIIVTLNGVVENNTSRRIEVDECRGFVLVDAMAPFMFINNTDSKSAQLFTIAHELAHIWTGHSAGFDFRKLQPANDPIEILCDKIAAEFLLPADSFHVMWDQYKNFKTVAKYFKVSEIVVARRALDLGKINKNEFFAFYDEYITRDAFKKDTQGSGGDFHKTTKYRLSLTFAGHINHAVKSGKLLYRDAYGLTSLKGNTFEKFFSKYLY